MDQSLWIKEPKLKDKHKTTGFILCTIIKGLFVMNLKCSVKKQNHF